MTCDPPETTTLKEKKLCIHYQPVIYYNEKGEQCRSNMCKLVEVTTTCGTLRKNRKCPRKRSEYPVKHEHKGKQQDLGGYKA